MKQSEIMCDGEGDAWFDRNVDHLGEVDPVSDMVDELKIVPGTALEIGCANGWRLARWRKRYGAACLGIEPSQIARRAGLSTILPGTAETLNIVSGWADTLVYGFCLYLTDPDDWLRIAAEGDRVLATGGYLIIHDFFAGSQEIEARVYKHDRRMLAYHFDFAQLWLAHPRYTLLRRKIIGADDQIVVLRKTSIRTRLMQT